MIVQVNGQPQDVPAGTTVEALLALLNVKAQRVAVELNQTVVRRAQHGLTTLADGDQLEIVTFVGGG